jgi:hypothetical protein
MLAAKKNPSLRGMQCGNESIVAEQHDKTEANYFPLFRILKAWAKSKDDAVTDATVENELIEASHAMES